MAKLDKYKEAFLSEAREYIDKMNKALIKLEKKPANMGLVSDIFIEIHTLKSMAASMEYNNIETLCHAIEDVLDAVRKNKVKLNECIDTLFESFDALESSLKEINKGKDELNTDGLVSRLQEITKQEAGSKKLEAVNSSVQHLASSIEKITTIEVKVERLDLLMNLAEELLINKMRIDGVKDELQNPELTASVDALSRVVSDMQYNVMQARLVPIGFVFNRFPRMVRDLAKKQGKEINLKMEGGDIELDRGVIDEIGESVVHLLRNAIDHGLETPEERKKAGKPDQGTIKLIATRTRGFAIIEVADDGRGLDLEDIKTTAIKQGILTPGASKNEVLDSIFSGVSTTKKVSAVSGRGFGLNIVRKKVESLGGAIKVESDVKKATRFVIEIPLTLAIIKTLFMDVGGRTYALPVANIERLVTIDEKEIKGMLEYEAIVLDEEDIPITRLNSLFRTTQVLSPSPLGGEGRGEGGNYTNGEKQPIVIVKKGEEKLGLAVDALMSTKEIVVKPLNRLVRENRYFAGSTIVGSGEVVLILDVSNLILSRRMGSRTL